MNKNLRLLVSFATSDRLSGPLKNIVGLGQSGSEKLAALKREARDANKELKEQRADIVRAVAAGEKLGSMVAREREMADAVEKTNDLLKKQERLNRINAQADAIQQRGADMRSSGTDNIVTGVAMAAPMVLAAKQAATFESSMADIRKVVDFDNPKQFAQMGDDIVDMSTRIPIAAEGLAQIVAAAGRAGVARKELLTFAEDAAQMGVAFDTTAEDAGEMMAKWRTAFGLGQDDTRMLADQINALTNTYGGNVTAVAGITTRIGALGKVAGLAAPEIAAMGQLMNAVGVEEEIAATGIKNMMLAMTKGTAATKTQQKAFGALGLDATKVADAMQKDAGGAITDLLTRLRKLPQAQQAAALTQLFGSESVSAIAPMLTNLERLQSNFALVGDQAKYAGSMNKEYLSRIATTEGAVGLATNALKGINITLGAMLLPTITAVSHSVVSIANNVRDWANENPRLAKGLFMTYTAVTGLVLGVGALKIGFGLLLGPFGTIFRLVLTNGPLVYKAFSLIRAGMMLLGGPVLAVAAVIGVAAYLIYSHWDAIKGYFTRNWTFIRNLMLGAMVIFTPWLAAIVFVAKKIYDNWDAISSGIRNAVTTIWSYVQPAVAPILNILTTIEGLKARFLNIGVDLMRGLLKGIWEGAKAVLTGVGNIASSIGARFAKVLDINSPSRVFMAMGGYITDGLASGIDRGRKDPMRSVSDMASGVAGSGIAPIARAGGSAGSSASSFQFGPGSIVINGTAGQSAQSLAEAVIAEMRKLSDQAGASRRSSFSDA